LRPRLAHILNPLHIYCRLRDMWIPDLWARAIGRFYEAICRSLGAR